MLCRHIPLLVLVAGSATGQPGHRLLSQAERAIQNERFSFDDAREALESACRSPASVTDEALCWNDRGLWQHLQGQFTQAEALYVRTVSALEKAPVANERLLATTLHNLGATYRELGRLEDAKQVLSRALSLRRAAYGDANALTANTLGQLGTVYLAAGELTRAEALLQSAVSIHARLLPPSHPDRVTTVHNLALLRIAQGRYEPAMDLLRGIVAPLDGIGVAPSLVQAAPYQTLASLYRRLGQPARALPLLRKAQRLYEDSFGPEDLSSALVRVEFGLLSAAEGNNQLAKSQFRDARARLIEILGPHHPQVASVENNLAVVCLQLGSVEEAGELLEQAIETVGRAEDVSERELGTYLANMAEVRRRQGKLLESEAHLKEALRLLEQALGPDSPEVLKVLEQYAMVLKARRSRGVQDVLRRIKAFRPHSTEAQPR